MIKAIERARHKSQPSIDSLIARLPDLGESIRNAAVDLSDNCTLEGVDALLSRLQTATTSLVHLRKAMTTEVPPDVVI